MASTGKQYLLLVATLFAMVFFLAYGTFPSVVVAETVAQTYNQNYSQTYPQAYTPTHIQPYNTPVASQGEYEYLEVTESCDSYLAGICIPVYAGPGVEYEKIYELRKGMLLKIKDTETRNGQTWYRVHFDEWLRYPERVPGDWYIPAVSGRVVRHDGEEILTSSNVSTSKRIIVDLSDHLLYAYDGNERFLTAKVATGNDSTPTPVGTFTIYKKTPTRYMQGPLAGVTDVPFDLPGVPWNMYFTQGGAVIHGTYWHDDYGTQQSSGCINLPPPLAKILYEWAPVGTKVIVQN